MHIFVHVLRTKEKHQFLRIFVSGPIDIDILGEESASGNIINEFSVKSYPRIHILSQFCLVELGDPKMLNLISRPDFSLKEASSEFLTCAIRFPMSELTQKHIQMVIVASWESSGPTFVFLFALCQNMQIFVKNRAHKTGRNSS